MLIGYFVYHKKKKVSPLSFVYASSVLALSAPPPSLYPSFAALFKSASFTAVKLRTKGGALAFEDEEQDEEVLKLFPTFSSFNISP